MTARAYAGDTDLERILALLAAARAGRHDSHDLHGGDLVWRLCYLLGDHEPGDIVRLWEDERGELIGYGLVYPPYAGFDVQLHPAHRDRQVEAEMLDWAVDATTRLRTRPGLDTDVHERDQVRAALLTDRGFRQRPAWVSLHRELGADPLTVDLPAGYAVRPLAEDDLEQRAAAARAAFGTEPDAERYRRLMRQPSHRDAIDLVVTAPDGSVAAFCIAWVDEANRVGQLEPVGCHPDHQRRGLGRALLHTAFDALRRRGMREVVVLAHAGSSAQRFYQDVGMRPGHEVHSFRRDG